MLLFSILLVIVGRLETSGAFLSFIGSRDVFHEQPTPQTQTPSYSTQLNQFKLFPLSLQLWKDNEFGAAFTNECGSGPAYPNVYVCWKDNEEDHCLKPCKKVTREGKHCYIIDLFFKEVESLKFFILHYSTYYLSSRGKNHPSIDHA